jgi:cytochrome P450
VGSAQLSAVQEFGPAFLSQRAAIAKLPYMEAAIAETLRLLNGGTAFSSGLQSIPKRVLSKDVPCGDYVLRAGSRVMVVFSYLMTSEETFQLPDGTGFDMAFRPERFIQVRCRPLLCMCTWDSCMCAFQPMLPALLYAVVLWKHLAACSDGSRSGRIGRDGLHRSFALHNEHSSPQM